MPDRAPLPLLAKLVICMIAVSAARAGTHPTLLMTPDDVPRLRHACGIGEPGGAAFGRFGSRSAEWGRLRQHFRDRVGQELLPGELAAAAFIHLVSPEEPGGEERLALIETALLQNDLLTTDPLEKALALDWCWAALKPGVRREYLTALRARTLMLTPADSPLDPLTFHEKLTALAVCIAIDAMDEPGPAWRETRVRVLDAANAYFQSTFPKYVEWRGLTPTGPAVAASEECLSALAVEFSSLVRGENAWKSQSDKVGRWMEHYWLLANPHTGLRHQFVRDEAANAPLTPLPRLTDMFPVTAHLIAARTGDPAARAVTLAVEHNFQASGAHVPSRGVNNPFGAVWGWVPILFDVGERTHGEDPTHPPDFIARNLNGALVFRAPGLDGPLIWIDSGQPFLRRRQHFDAGSFLISAGGGHLCVNAGDDVLYEAVPAKGGAQNLGGEKPAFDFEQFCTATIAHNCMVFWDPARSATWYDKPYVPVGGQRLAEDTCSDFSVALEGSPRETARLRAYGQHQDGAFRAAYACIDLKPAYDAKSVTSYTREFILVLDRALLVIDRVDSPRTRSVPTWIVNIPARPLVDGAALETARRVAGATDEGGIWRYDNAKSIRWADREGTLWVAPLLPEQRAVRLTGGPAVARVIPGTAPGRTYIGGEADSFERLVLPGERVRAFNAWYRLGTPTLLGEMVGHVPLWGRVEIEPDRPQKEYLFATLLVAGHAAAALEPSVSLKKSGAGFEISVQSGPAKATIKIPAKSPGGSIESGSGSWNFPADVQPDPPLAR